MGKVYIANESQCPDDAVVHRGPRGGLYYVSEERGEHGHVGGNKNNTLLDMDREDLVKRELAKPFQGPDGQQFDDFEDCVETVGEWDDIENPEAVCGAWQAEYKNKQEWVGPLEGPKGGTYWENTQTGERHYGDEPPGVSPATDDNQPPSVPDDTWSAMVDSAERWMDSGVTPREALMGVLDLYGYLGTEEEDEVSEALQTEFEEAGHDATVYASRKRRVYITDPSEVPEGVQVQEGPWGGLYYEQETRGGPSYDPGTALEYLGEELEPDDYAFVHGDARDVSDVEDEVGIDYAPSAKPDVSEEDFSDFVDDVRDKLGEKYFVALNRYVDNIDTQGAYSVSRDMVDMVIDDRGMDNLKQRFQDYSGVELERSVGKGWEGPFEGPRGGVYWENVETGDRHYGEDPPTDVRVDDDPSGQLGPEDIYEVAFDNVVAGDEFGVWEVAVDVAANTDPVDLPPDPMGAVDEVEQIARDVAHDIFEDNVEDIATAYDLDDAELDVLRTELEDRAAESAVEQFRDDHEPDRPMDHWSAKRRIYIPEPDHAPEGVQVEEGPRGGFYYEVVDDPDDAWYSDEHQNAMSDYREYAEDFYEYAQDGAPDDRTEQEIYQDVRREVRQHVRDNIQDDLDIDPDDEEWEGFVEDTVDEVLPNEVFQGLRRSSGMAQDKQKRRVYIQDPSEAPEDANVQEGPRGGLYYERPSDDYDTELVDGVTVGAVHDTVTDAVSEAQVYVEQDEMSPEDALQEAFFDGLEERTGFDQEDWGQLDDETYDELMGAYHDAVGETGALETISPE